MYDENTKKIFKSRDVVFCEDKKNRTENEEAGKTSVYDFNNPEEDFVNESENSEENFLTPEEERIESENCSNSESGKEESARYKIFQFDGEYKGVRHSHNSGETSTLRRSKRDPKPKG